MPYTLGSLLPLLRYKAFNRHDEGMMIILAPECEEYTHVIINVNSGFLDLLADVVVDSIDTDDDKVRLWIATGDFNVPLLKGEDEKDGRTETVPILRVEEIQAHEPQGSGKEQSQVHRGVPPGYT